MLECKVKSHIDTNKTCDKSNEWPEDASDGALPPGQPDAHRDQEPRQGTVGEAHLKNHHSAVVAMIHLEGSDKRWSPGCVNAAGKARKKW